jgi:hypothetical protein
MDFTTLLLSAVIGFAAGFAWVYTRNPFAGIAVVGVGAFLLFGMVSVTGGTPVIDSFVESVGIGGVLAAIAGGIAGWYAGDRMRSQ